MIAWLWARTVKSPNPTFAHVDVPLASTFMLSTKKGKEAWVEPVVEGGGYRFTVRDGAPGSAGVRGRNARPATGRRSEAEGPPDPENTGVPPAGRDPSGNTGVPARIRSDPHMYHPPLTEAAPGRCTPSR